MRRLNLLFLMIAISTLTNCASKYRAIQPKSINYISENRSDGVKLEYKYNLLHKKYEKKS